MEVIKEHSIKESKKRSFPLAKHTYIHSKNKIQKCIKYQGNKATLKSTINKLSKSFIK